MATPGRVRPVPSLQVPVYRFRLCTFCPPQVCRLGDRCTFAHSDEELTAWNAKRMTNYGTMRQFHAPPQQDQSAVIRRQQSMYRSKNRAFLARRSEGLYIEDIEPELTVTNYKDKFHKLLCWEEMEHITVLHERCDGCYPMEIFVGSIPDDINSRSISPDRKYGYLDVQDGDIIAYATQASEAVYLIVQDGKERIEIEAKILHDNFKHTGNKMYISVHKDNNLSNAYKKIEIEFEVKHWFFDNMHEVLNNLHNGVVRRIFPQKEDFTCKVIADVRLILRHIPKEYENIFHLSINDMEPNQLEAYQVALSCQSGAPPVLISGAFGTGKTCFLSSVAYCFISEAERNGTGVPARVLICAHQQATADTILQTYFGPMLEHESLPLQTKVFRVISNQRNVFPKQKYSRWYRKIDDFKKEACRYFYIPSLVVITTFLTSFKLFPSDYFTHILIDEGAQAREPEAVAPLCLANQRTKIIIAGDARQVGPALLVLGEEAQVYGLKASLLERLQDHYEKFGDRAKVFKATLQKNFRCQQDILKFSSDLFYNSSVKVSHTCLKRCPHPVFSYPLVFVCTSAKELRHYEQNVNQDEAALLMDMLTNGKQNKTRSVCVMSSSRGQVTIMRRLHKQKRCAQSIRVLPTYDIQGQEYDSLYISTCESTLPDGNTRNPTKSICDPFVFNTAITRAKSLIVSFGDPYLLLSIEKHMIQKYDRKGYCWSQYLMRCLLYDTLILPDSVMKCDSRKKEYKVKLKQFLESSLSTTSDKASMVTQPTLAIRPQAIPRPTPVKNSSVPEIPTRVLTATAGFSPAKPQLKSSEFRTLAESKDVQTTKGSQSPVQMKQRPIKSSTEYFKIYEKKLSMDIVTQPLTINNYKEKFHDLLCWEEKEHIEILTKRCDGRHVVKVERTNFSLKNLKIRESSYARYGFIYIEDADDMSYAQQAAEAVHISISDRTRVFATFVTNRLYNGGILLGFSKEAVQTLTQYGLTYEFESHIKFEIKHSYFQRQHDALKKLPMFVIAAILPTNIQARPKFNTHKGENVSTFRLDETGQRRALETIVNTRVTTPIIVAGPFGTGKTRVLARAAFELITSQECKILICAHHQASADTFIKYFCEMQHSKADCIVRIATPDYKSQMKKNYPDNYTTLQDIHLRHEVPNIIVTTLGLSLHIRIRGFTHIFIDEAAQTRETEAIIPLTLANRQTKIVLAGDHCQVGPNLLVFGETARKYGLSISLLERLHKRYDEITGTAHMYSLSLLSNYRSHSGLLMLSSSLFYGSTLQCHVPDSMAHPYSPFPLVFVCSDIKQITAVNSKNTDMKEAAVLVKQVKKYIDSSWPTATWGEMDSPSGKVCIMTPSPTQKKEIYNELKKSPPLRDQNVVDVLTAYDIQGREFTAVFIGTCEATDEDGIPKNTTKTIINRYVFNTALTRAKYLVVAVGNPLQLLQKEQNMIERYPEHRNYHCWKEYIRRCIECNSFQLPKDLKKEEADTFREVLYHKVFTSSNLCISSGVADKRYGHGNDEAEDSILSAYKKKFENIPECRKSKLALSRVKGGNLTWNIREKSDPEKSFLKETQKKTGAMYYTCILNVLHFSKAEAIPLISDNRVVQIRGMGNMQGAFHDDIVEVMVFDDCPETKCLGKVVKVIKRCHKQNLVCNAHRYNPVLFCPVSKKYPIISNLPKLSRDVMRKKDKSGIDAELQSKDVVVFDPNSLSDNDIPQIANVISHSIAQNMLFVVRILMWNPKFRLPLGIVVHALPKGFSTFHAERLLLLEHDLHLDDESGGFSSQVAQTDMDNLTEGDIDTRAFTIDPEDAVNLDDAISLTKEEKTCYKLAVHIVNTTNHIKIDDEVDKKAATRCVSVYGIKRVMMNMLPQKTRSKLSLKPHQTCEVMTVLGEVNMSKEEINITQVDVKETKIRSCAKLSYKSAQDIMDGNVGTSRYKEIARCVQVYDCDTKQPCFKDTLTILFQIAQKLRINRLGYFAAMNYEMDDEQECWQSHLMVEEIMIWANNSIAKKLYSAYPDCALLRKQSAPNAETLAAFSSLHSPILGHSHALSQYVSSTSHHQMPLVLTMDTLHLISEALKLKDMKGLHHLLTTDSLYPQLSVASCELKKIQQKAEYCSTTCSENRSVYHHHGLRLNTYTQFTSPLRRYTDIIVQRMIKSLINGVDSSYIQRDIVALCQRLNAAACNAKSFEKKRNCLDLALKYTNSSESYEAYIMKNRGGEIEFTFLEQKMKYLRASQKKIKIRYLKCTPLKKGGGLTVTPLLESSTTKEHTDSLHTWKVKLVSVDNPCFIYNYDELSFHESGTAEDFTGSKNIFVKLYRPLLDSDMLESVEYTVTTSPNTVALSPVDWGKFMKFIQNPSEEARIEIESIVDTASTQCRKQNVGVQDQVKSPVVICDVTCRIDMYDVINIWMTWSTREAILSPQLQLLEITPFLRVCLQHNSHPAECFSDVSLKNASKERYTDLNEYVHLWEKVLLAEAAERSVGDSQISILCDVKLKWPDVELPEQLDGIHYEPTGPFKLLLSASFDRETKPFFKIHVGDFMCVRYGTKKNSNIRAVFHMVVTGKRIENNDDPENKDIILLLKAIGRENCKVSEQMKSLYKEKCEIQVLTMSPSYQRVYNVLLNLLNTRRGCPVSNLVKDVAQGNDDKFNRKLPRDISVDLTPFHCYPLAINLWSREEKLNKSQSDAMKLALTKQFLLIQGPPGTGKSETGAHIAYALAMSNHIKGSGHCVLYCAPTNKAVDVVLKNLHCLCSKTSIKILRVYGQAVENREYPGPYSAKATFQVSDSEYQRPHWALPYALHCIIRKSESDVHVSQKITEMEQTFRDEHKKGHIPNAKMCQEWKDLVDKAEKVVLGNTFDIVLCTCNEAASKRIVKNLKNSNRLVQCIIDESGMAYEPETIVPMSLCEHVILLGDHKQLQPVIKHKLAKDNGLTTSLFERYADSRGDKFCMMLDLQYRMHDEICKFPSKYFYGERLKTDSSVLRRNNYESNLKIWPKGPKYPIVFCDSVGKEETQVGWSKSNPDEAMKVIQIARVLHQVYKVKLSEIALMTPYTAQKATLKTMADNAGLLSPQKRPGVTVATITESQGDEYGIVILSTVRSQPLAEIQNEDHVQPDRSWMLENLGFLTDKHEINVGITRSKYGLIIVGNKMLLRYDDTWGALIQHYSERGCVVDGSQFPKKKDLENIKI